jgi:fructose-1,6-bisphosphatase/inositol monophosphatase family enzyme
VAAGIVIVRGAGGVVTRLDGSEIDLDEGWVLAANSTGRVEALGALVRG